MTIHITIPGVPIPKHRPRRSKWGGMYSDQKDEEKAWKQSAVVQFYRQRRCMGLLDGPISLVCQFFMPIPKSLSKCNRAYLPPHTKKPDLDNLVKWVKDCLNKIAWDDDAQVDSITATKRYDDVPRTEVYIS